MKTLLRPIVFVVAACTASVISGCSEDYRTSPFVASHVATVTGRVAHANGAPAQGVSMYVSFPDSAGLGKTTPAITTNARGEFTYPVEIMGARMPRPSPDTVRATVGAIAYALRVGTSEPPTVTGSVLVTLAPRGATPPSVAINLQLPTR